jgi:DNA polymerase III epsilon subunit-like protein
MARPRTASVPKKPAVITSFWVNCFDTETTGLTKPRIIPLIKQPEIIEFYAAVVDLKSGEVDRELELLIKPFDYPMSLFTIKETKTKIPNAELKDCPVFKEVAADVKTFLENCGCLLAHNLAFDKEMVNIEMERIKQTMTWPKQGICTVEQTCHLKGHRLTLTKLYDYLFKEKFDDAHRAKPDTQAMIRCAIELHRRDII